MFTKEDNKIFLDDNFNKDLSTIDLSDIDTIIFGEEFNQPLYHLPKHIKKIKLHCYFNQPLDLLHEGLEEIVFDITNQCFQYDLLHLPTSLRVLKLSFFYNKFFHQLPENIEVLRMPYWYTHQWNLPPKLKMLLLPLSPPPIKIWNNEYNKYRKKKSKIDFVDMSNDEDFYQTIT